MSEKRILIVEDEQLVARDLQIRLRRMGYDVPATASSGRAALELIALHQPDLVLTDIRLGGESDGIELATEIRFEHNVPVIFISAFADDETLERAQLTEPYGYVLKPFHDRELQIAIEIAVYKHRIERDLRENRSWLAAILQSIGDAVIATDAVGRVVFLNPAAEALTEWTQVEARGIDLNVIYNVLTRKNFLSPWSQLSESPMGKTFLTETVLVSRNGKEISIQSAVSLLKDVKGREIGEVVVFRDCSAREANFLPELK